MIRLETATIICAESFAKFSALRNGSDASSSRDPHETSLPRFMSLWIIRRARIIDRMPLPRVSHGHARPKLSARIPWIADDIRAN